MLVQAFVTIPTIVNCDGYRTWPARYTGMAGGIRGGARVRS